MNKQGSIVSAYAGHAVDLVRMARFSLKVPHSYTKLRNIIAVARLTRSKQFVETGTYLGNTSKRAARHFDHVYTIELDPDLFTKAASYLASSRNVTPIKGDALVELPKVMARDDVTDAVVFLDGHFSGPGTAQGDTLDPACEALELLAEFQPKVNGIIIDDFRMFGLDPNLPPKGRSSAPSSACLADDSKFRCSTIRCSSPDGPGRSTRRPRRHRRQCPKREPPACAAALPPHGALAMRDGSRGHGPMRPHPESPP